MAENDVTMEEVTEHEDLSYKNMRKLFFDLLARERLKVVKYTFNWTGEPWTEYVLEEK